MREFLIFIFENDSVSFNLRPCPKPISNRLNQVTKTEIVTQIPYLSTPKKVNKTETKRKFITVDKILKEIFKITLNLKRNNLFIKSFLFYYKLYSVSKSLISKQLLILKYSINLYIFEFLLPTKKSAFLAISISVNKLIAFFSFSLIDKLLNDD